LYVPARGDESAFCLVATPVKYFDPEETHAIS